MANDYPYYHVLNRGVDKRKIFLDKQDYLRFIHNLYFFNDEEFKSANSYYFLKDTFKKKEGKQLADILIFVLMPNHYHLFLVPKTEEGILKFIRRVDIGYAKYFNQKYKRKGTLFESKYKAVEIKDETHFIHLPYYLHCNPLDLIQPEWREGKIKDYKKAIEFLENYRWSSHLDYLGKRNFPSVINKKILLDFFGGEKDYQDAFYSWLKDKTHQEIIRKSLLEYE